MKYSRCLLLASTLLPGVVMAQSAVDAMSLNSNNLRGTARYVSMGGAFGALGGDLSTLGNNPAGIGVYRSSEVGMSLDIDIMSNKSGATTMNKTKVYLPNLGYVGTWDTGSEAMPFFNWGVSYGRVGSFDRVYSGYMPGMSTSLTNYVAGFTDGWTGSDLYSGQGKNPYMNTYAPWMSILFYNGGLINPIANSPQAKNYMGLGQQGSMIDGAFDIVEHGYVDEYNLNVGGNFINKIFWGFGIGVKDVSFEQTTLWGEHIINGNVPYETASGDLATASGSGDYALNSYKHIWGTGVNVKLGIIVKPINQLRLGFAVETPTWYSITQNGFASTKCNFDSNPPIGPGGSTVQKNFNYQTWTNNGVDDRFDWDYQSPWRLMFSAAAVLGQKAIISADYEYKPYNQMKVKHPGYYGNWQPGYYDPYIYTSEDIKNYYQSTSTLRIGAEFRITSAFSVRAGYSYSSSPTKSESDINYLINNGLNMDTDGPDDTETTPSFILNQDTQYITCGVGYRFGKFYVDAAYAYRTNNREFRPWSTCRETAKITEHDSNIVLSAGFKF